MQRIVLICASAIAAGCVVCPQTVSAQDTLEVSQEPDQSSDSDASGAGSEATNDSTSPDPTVVAKFGEGFASDETVRSAVGSITYHMDSCAFDDSYLTPPEGRLVTATVSRVPADLEQRPAIIDAIFRNAARFAWNTCPFPFVDLDHQPRGEFRYNLKQVSIHGPDGLIASARLGGPGLDAYGDQPFSSSRRGYLWLEYRNGLAEQREQETVARQQQAAAEQAQIQKAEEAERDHESAGSFWWKAKLFVLSLFLLWLYQKRDPIARWYYGLKPHPAKQMVERALYQGSEIDGRIYAQILEPVPGSPIERQVRANQADALTRRLRQHEAALRSEEASRVADVRRRVEQENAFMRAHAELLKAGVDHEVAAARVDELRKATQRP